MKHRTFLHYKSIYLRIRQNFPLSEQVDLGRDPALIQPASFQNALPQHVRPGGLAGGFPEIAAEIGGRREMQEVADLLDVVFPFLEQGFRLGDHILLDDEKGLLPGDLADDAGEVFRRDAELPGVVVQVAVLQAAGLDEPDEILRDGHLAGDPRPPVRPFHHEPRQAAAEHLGGAADDVVLELIVRTAARHVDEHLDQMHIAVHPFPVHGQDEGSDHRCLEDLGGTGSHRREKLPVIVAEEDVPGSRLPAQVPQERRRRNQQDGPVRDAERFRIEDAVHHAGFHEQDRVEADPVGKLQPVRAQGAGGPPLLQEGGDARRNPDGEVVGNDEFVLYVQGFRSPGHHVQVQGLVKRMFHKGTKMINFPTVVLQSYINISIFPTRTTHFLQKFAQNPPLW